MSTIPARCAPSVGPFVWHHVSTKPVEDGGRGPKELTGMVDLTRDQDGRVHARLLDLGPGRAGKACADRPRRRGEAFTQGVEVATLDPPPHAGVPPVITLGSQVLDDVRHRVQQDALGHRGRKGDPLYGIRNTLHAGAEKLTDRQWARLGSALDARAEHDAAWIAWSVAQRLRLAYRHPKPTESPQVAEQLLGNLRAVRSQRSHAWERPPERWRDASLAYFTTNGSSDGGTETVNGLIELHHRVARGFGNLTYYRLRMLLIGGGLSDPRLWPHQYKEPRVRS